jgi:SRSO17 transposase
LSALHARLGGLFVRAEPRRQAGLYLEGLLSAVERKNGWQLAEHLGDARPWRTQRLLSHVQWNEEAARDLCRGYVVEALADREAVLIVDETGFLKKGTKSAGGAHRELPDRRVSRLCQRQRACADRPRTLPAEGVG